MRGAAGSHGGAAAMKSHVRPLLRRLGLLELAYRLHEQVTPAGRARAGAVRRAAERLFESCGDHAFRLSPSRGDAPVALVMGVASVEIAAFQGPQILAARVAGFRVVVVLSTPSPTLESLYERFGVEGFAYMTSIIGRPVREDAATLMAGVQTQTDYQSLGYREIAVGKYALSTIMRRTRRGRIDPAATDNRPALLLHLSAAMDAADEAIWIMQRHRPRCVFFIDRGYTPEGEFFDASFVSGAWATTLNTAHRGSFVIVKRYWAENKRRHFASLSDASWARIKAMPFGDARSAQVETEIRTAYESGQWYEEVGTQFGKRSHDRDEVIRSLGLDPRRKTGVLFAHMFWDATFFWGEDLFEDYEDWFVQSLAAMASNTNLNWIVKLHPANAVKDARDGYTGSYVEYAAIERAVGTLPDHIRVMAPDNPINTFSLFKATDFCLTVRGTVGIEAACFGLPVLTAGTGRYDGLGFTRDHDSAEAYLQTVRRLPDIEPMDDEAVELARRFAWGLLFARTLKSETVRVSFDQDDRASMRTMVDPRAVEDPASMPDVAALAVWLTGEDEDYLDPQCFEEAAVS